jgi:hypothetical protein
MLNIHAYSIYRSKPDIIFQELILRIKELLEDFSCFAQLVSIAL